MDEGENELSAETVEKLKDIKNRFGGDQEAAHDMADTALCDLLLALGYKEVVEAWNAIPKWYA